MMNLQQLDSDNLTSKDTANISQIVLNEITNSEDNVGGLPGGDIIQTANTLMKLINVQENMTTHSNSFTINKFTTTNILNSTNLLFNGSSVGWQEIQSNDTRYQTSSNLLSVTNSAPFLLFNQSSDAANETYQFETDAIYLTSMMRTQNSSEQPFCQRSRKTEICVPNEVFDQLDVPSAIYVAAEYLIDVKSGLFPSTIQDQNLTDSYSDASTQHDTVHNLQEYLVGLTIDNSSAPIVIDDPKHPIKITFRHESTEVQIHTIH